MPREVFENSVGELGVGRWAAAVEIGAAAFELSYLRLPARDTAGRTPTAHLRALVARAGRSAEFLGTRPLIQTVPEPGVQLLKVSTRVGGSRKTRARRWLRSRTAAFP